ASPAVLKAMKRPAHGEKTLERIQRWRSICPDLTLRSTFIVGFPGETEDDFQQLLQWLEAAQLDRVGCFQYSPVEGAAANALPNAVPDDIKQERWERFMATAQKISAAKMQQKIGREIDVLIDEVDEDGAIGRSKADAPEIDGAVYLNDAAHLQAGQIVRVRVDAADEYDLWASLI
ncbi:MAG TPA: radical SAM protein, partial [Pseudomonadales bacterium]|nr:radical SAM protein [Pseudomonadales bacterium]